MTCAVPGFSFGDRPDRLILASHCTVLAAMLLAAPTLAESPGERIGTTFPGQIVDLLAQVTLGRAGISAAIEIKRVTAVIVRAR